MRYFITGASGWIGSAVARELIAAGHRFTGLARSDASASAVQALGGEVVQGGLADLEVLREQAAAADGVIHLGFVHDFSDFENSVRVDRAAIEAFGEALGGSGKALVIASGVAGVKPGAVATEDDQHVGNSRGDNAILALSYVDRGIRPLIVRFAPSVHGLGGDHGFIATIARIARARGVSAYIGDGEHAWAAVNRLDAAELVRLAVESPDIATVLHATAEDGVPTKAIAEAIGERLDLPVASVGLDQADEHFGWMARFFGMDLRATSTLTRERYGWTPTRPTLLDDIAAGGYDVPAA